MIGWERLASLMWSDVKKDVDSDRATVSWKPGISMPNGSRGLVFAVFVVDLC